jgi:GT2 family glycosyltransferase
VNPTDVPFVSMIVPVRNEAAGIEACLGSLRDQTYAADRFEILVVDGQSSDDTADRTRDIAAVDARVRLLENPDRTMPHGLDRGIAAARGDVIGVMSGHATGERDYIERCVDALARTGAWAVGGSIVRVATNPMQRAIAIATSSSLGVGDARHDYATEAGEVETVFPGMWPRWVFERVGLFDPEMTFNEDNELSLRIRRAGGRIWMDPAIRVSYTPRGSLAGLWRQYFGYARGKLQVWRKHRGGLRWRHLVPPAFVAAITLGLVGGMALPWLWGAAGLAVVVYLVVMGGGSIVLSAGREAHLVLAALATMHVAYGLGFWRGTVDLATDRIRRR